MNPKVVLGSAVLAIMVTLSIAARATPSAVEIAVARRLFQEATELEQQGRWAEAARVLKEAIAIKDTPGLRFHLATSEAQQGHLVEALIEFDRASDLIAAGEPGKDVAQLLGPAKEDLRQRIPTVHVLGLTSTRGVSLAIDGKPVSSALILRPIPLNPGPHKIVVRLFGSAPQSFDVQLEEGERRLIRLEKPKLAAQHELPKREDGDPRVASPESGDKVEPVARVNTGRRLVLVSGGLLTVVGVGVGTGFWLHKDALDDRADRLERDLLLSSSGPASTVCGNPSSTETRSQCAAYRKALLDSRGARDVAIAGFITAGAGALATLVTAIVWDSEESAPTGLRSTFRATLTPALGSGVGLNVGGSF